MSAWIIKSVINVACILLTLCPTSQIKLWRDPKLACYPGRQTMVDGCCSEGNECRVDIINQWSIVHSHLSYAIDVCPVNKIHYFSCCRLKYAFLNWSSRHRLNNKGTLNLPLEGFWGMQTCPWPRAGPPFSGCREVKVFENRKYSRSGSHSGISLLHWSNSSLREPNAQCQRWNISLRWFIYHWNVGTWRVWDSLGLINPGNFIIQRTMNLGRLHCIRGKQIHKHWIIDRYRLHMCHDHHQNAWNWYLCVVFCDDNEACHVVNKGLILPQIVSFPCNKLLTGFVWNLSLVNIHLGWWIQLFGCLIGYRVRCQRCRLTFILLIAENIDLPKLGI